MSDGHALIKLLDSDGAPPRAAMWVHAPDTDTWKLWLVPYKGLTDQRDFYRRISAIISLHRDQFSAIDAGDVQMLSDSHPAISALSRMFGMIGLSDARIVGNTLNGFYVPDGILMRMAL
ncbi:hypothetical protein [Phenylobacterium sp.]|uniref:hypothetical protein n=1 Tax=Phenylobacterium sp. TaxID=1871053 RepID=UPI0027376DA6|nr:hypothetical protein [Phenylobacterium sp.]MDP3633587.1 hypothetical protein [Phenylobacterium sp.]MDZ4052651.1 hypothetical protein [Phenylobacterium sp.]